MFGPRLSNAVLITVVLSFTLASAAEAANRKVERTIKRSKANSAQVAEVTGQVEDLEARVTTVEGTANDNAGTIESNALDTGLALDELYGRVGAIEASLCDLSGGIWDAVTLICSPPSRFQACDGGLTVADIVTGLLWERKTTTAGLNSVDNRYDWTLENGGTTPDGTAYTVFLAGLNSAAFAGHTDWRLPVISELQSIMIGPGVTRAVSVSPADPASGLNETEQATTCSAAPCIDPGFAAIGGPTESRGYWSSASNTVSSTFAWIANFIDGQVDGINYKYHDNSVRAVRAGSCTL